MNTILNSLVAPELHDPVRLPTYPVIERTSVLGFNVPASLELQDNTTRVLVTRQPVYPFWADQTVAGFFQAATWRSALLPAIGPAGPSLLNVDFMDPIETAFTGNQTAGTSSNPGPGVTGTLGTLPYTGTTPIMGQCDTRNYIYIPANHFGGVLFGAYQSVNIVAINATITLVERINDEDVKFTVTGSITAGKTAGFSALLTSTRDRWVSVLDMELQGASSITVQESFFVTVTAMGALSVSYADSTVAGNHGTINVTPGEITGLFPISMAPDISVTQLPWRFCRTTAAAASLTNVSTILAKSGSILAGRVDPSRFWPFAITRSQVANLHKADKCVSSLQTGFYTYVPPSTDVASFTDYLTFTERTGAFLPVYRLDNTAICHVLFLSNLAADKQNVSLSLSWHIEFRNTSTLFPLGVSKTTLELMHQTQLKMMTMGFFHTNSNIPSILKGNFKGGLDDKRSNVRVQPSRLMTAVSVQPRTQQRRPRSKQRPNGANRPRQPPTPRKAQPKPQQKRKGGLQMYLDSRK